jgi:hypothetical protein
MTIETVLAIVLLIATAKGAVADGMRSPPN